MKWYKTKQAKTGLWQIANGLVSLLIVYLTDANYAYAPMIVVGLNFLTKELNKRYL